MSAQTLTHETPDSQAAAGPEVPRARRSVVGRVLHGLVLVVMALVLLAALVVLIVPHVSSWEFRVVNSGSMQKTIPQWSIIVVEPMDGARPKVGEVIVFDEPETARTPADSNEPRLVIVHRVLERRGGHQSITKGDSNPREDNWVVDDRAVHGHVVGSMPAIGYVVHLLQTYRALWAVLVLPALFLLMSDASAFRRRRVATVDAHDVDAVVGVGPAPAPLPAPTAPVPVEVAVQPPRVPVTTHAQGALVSGLPIELTDAVVAAVIFTALSANGSAPEPGVPTIVPPTAFTDAMVNGIIADALMAPPTTSV